VNRRKRLSHERGGGKGIKQRRFDIGALGLRLLLAPRHCDRADRSVNSRMDKRALFFQA
jgi:hypothetical protein